MAYDNGKEIVRPSKARPGPSLVRVTVKGIKGAVTIHHVSNETLTGASRPAMCLLRRERRLKRAARMRIRKRRGWR